MCKGYNVCKTYGTKYKATTAISTLHNQLKKHQLEALSMRQRATTTKIDLFSEPEQIEHAKYLME